jgi:hypothetical protein
MDAFWCEHLGAGRPRPVGPGSCLCCEGLVTVIVQSKEWPTLVGQLVLDPGVMADVF